MAWVFFRAETVSGATEMLSAMAGQNGFALPLKYMTRWGEFSQWLIGQGVAFYDLDYFKSTRILYHLIGILIVCVCLPNTQQLMSHYRPALDAHTTTRKGLQLSHPLAIATGLAAVVCLVNMNKASEFLYFQF